MVIYSQLISVTLVAIKIKSCCYASIYIGVWRGRLNRIANVFQNICRAPEMHVFKMYVMKQSCVHIRVVLSHMVAVAYRIDVTMNQFACIFRVLHMLQLIILKKLQKGQPYPIHVSVGWLDTVVSVGVVVMLVKWEWCYVYVHCVW